MMIDCDRFFIAMDMNGDGLTTISDVWGWLQVAFFAPAKVVMLLIEGVRPLASFFEVNCVTGTGLGAAAFSLVAWLFVGAAMSAIAEQKH